MIERTNMNLRVAIAILLFSLSVVGQTDRPARKMAITFDDLPYVVVGQQGLASAQRATKEILRVLKAHDVPVVAFVNESKLQVTGEVDARIALLQNWVDAGMILGN